MEVPQLLPIPHHGPTAYRPQPQVAVGVLDGPERIVRDLQLGRGVYLHMRHSSSTCRRRLSGPLASGDQQHGQDQDVVHAVKLGMKKPTPRGMWVCRSVARRGFEPLLPG